MTIDDVLRLAVCLALLVCLAFLYANMKPRLHDEDSYWLAGFVVIITLSAFLGLAVNIGSEEPIKWWGTPLRGLAAVAGLVYIWKTRPGRTR